MKVPLLLKGTSLPARLALRFPRPIALIFKKTGLGETLCWSSTPKLVTNGSRRPDDHCPARDSWSNYNGNEFGHVSLKDEQLSLPG